MERERATRRKRTRITIGALAGVAAIIAGIAVFAFIQRNDAADQRDVAQSRQLAASSREHLGADPEQALLLAQDAFGVAPTAQAEEALRQATTASRVRFAFRGHDGAVRAVASGVAGGLVASAGADGTVQLWDPRDPDVAPTVLRGHDGQVTSVAVGGGGRVVVSGGVDGTVRVWSAAGGAATRTLAASDEPIRSVAVTPDGRRIAAGGDDAVVRVWGGADAPVATLQAGGAAVRAVALSPDGRRAASGGPFDLAAGAVPVDLWNIDQERRIRSLDDLISDASGFVFTRDGRYLYGSSWDNTIRRWDVTGAEKPQKIDSLGVSLLGLALSPDERFVAAAGLDGAALVWPSTGGDEPLLRLPGQAGRQLGVAFVPGTSLILTAGDDGVVRVSDWSAADPPQLPSPITTRIGADGTVEIMGADGEVCRWDPVSGDREAVVGPRPEGFNWGTLSAEGDIARSVPGRSIIVEPRGGGRPITITGLPNEVYTLWLSDDGRWLAAAIAYGGARLYDLSEGAPASSWRPRAARPWPWRPRERSPSGTATGRSRSGRRPMRSRGRSPRSAQQITALAFTPDGLTLATGSLDGIVNVWPTAGGDPVASAAAHDGDRRAGLQRRRPTARRRRERRDPVLGLGAGHRTGPLGRPRRDGGPPGAGRPHRHQRTGGRPALDPPTSAAPWTRSRNSPRSGSRGR